MSLQKKLVLSMSLLSSLMFILVFGVVYNQMNKIIGDQENEKNKMMVQTMDNMFEEELDRAQAITLTIINNPQTQELFKKGEREGLIQALKPIYDSMGKDIAQMQFHEIDSTSFLRLHAIDKYGDSLKEFRMTVNAANSEKKIIRGLERGVKGYGLRVVAPVSYRDEHIGSFEVGLDFGEEFLDQIQEVLGGDYFLYTLAKEGFDETKMQNYQTGLLIGTVEEDSWMINEKDLALVKEGETVFRQSKNGDHTIILHPFLNYQGNLEGYYKVILSREAIKQKVLYTDLLLIVIFLIAITLLGISIFFVSKRVVVKPIKGLTSSIEKFSQYDFSSQSIKHLVGSKERKDEVGIMVRAMVKMKQNIALLVQEISAQGNGLASSSDTLAITSDETSKASDEVAKTIEQMAQAAIHQAEQTDTGAKKIYVLGQSIASSLDLMETLNSSADQIVQLKDNGSTSLESLVELSKENKCASKKIRTVIESTSTSAGKIEAASDMIQKISEQTNLLALNAAIEAARAGESGKGFAVVADEIRNLAVQSDTFSKEINLVIGDLMHKTQEAVAEVTTVEEIVDAQNSQAQVTLDKFNGISMSIEQIKDVIQKVHHSSQEMVRQKEDIIEIINNLSAVAEEKAASTEEVSASMEQQNAAMEEIAQASDDLAKIAEKMALSIEKFISD